MTGRVSEQEQLNRSPIGQENQGTVELALVLQLTEPKLTNFINTS